jgi:hypothetical protein
MMHFLYKLVFFVEEKGGEKERTNQALLKRKED